MFAIAMTCRFLRQRLRSVYWSRETITDIAMNDASQRGGLKLIEFMLDEGAEKEDFDPAFCIELAAGGGHLDVIEFFLDLEPNLEWTADGYTCTEAARGGHLHVGL